MAYFRAGTARATHEAQQITVAKTPLATFESNVSGLYLPEILAYIQATQAGTGDPSPSNIRPISGVSEVQLWGTGKNLINIADQSINTTYYWGYVVQTGIRVKSGYTYTFSCDIAGAPTPFRLSFGVGTTPTTYAQDVKHIDDYTNGHISGSYTVSSDHDGKYLFLRLPRYQTQTAIECTISNIQLELSDTATAYAPYTGTTATTALGGTYYGGYVNVPTGVLTVTDVIVDFSTFSMYSTGDVTFWYKLFDNILVPASNNEIGQVISEYYASVKYNVLTITPNAIAIRTNSYMYVNTGGNTPPQGNAVYKLATPITVQLTPAQIEQLLGQNNVFCSTGDVAVKYWKID